MLVGENQEHEQDLVAHGRGDERVERDTRESQVQSTRSSGFSHARAQVRW
jgi:hypothetical protein